MTTSPHAHNPDAWCAAVAAEADNIVAAGGAANRDEALEDATRIVRARLRRERVAAEAPRERETDRAPL